MALNLGADPAIWVCSIRDYNEGKNVGEWLTLTDYSTADEVLEAIYTLLNGWDDLLGVGEFEVPREEWTIHDFEGFPKRFYSEYMGFEEVLQWIEDTQDMDEDRKEAYELFLDNGSGDTLEQFEEAYQGYYGKNNWDDEGAMEDFCEEQITYMYEVPDFLQYYVDYKKMGRDWSSSDYWVEKGHIFRNI